METLINKKETIINAIKDKKVLSFNYDGLDRIVEGHAIGRHITTKNIFLRAYQIGGNSHSNEQPYWRMFVLGEISNLKVLNKNSEAPKNGYKKGDKYMSEIFYEV